MGQKTNPKGYRTGTNVNKIYTWDSRWYASGDDYKNNLHEDLAIRDYLKKKLAKAGVSEIIIERPSDTIRVTIKTPRPGIVIGRKGDDIEKIKKELKKIVNREVQLNIVEVRKPEIDAVIVAQEVARQIEKRISFRRAMKRAVQAAMRLGAKGIRINCSGRLGGAEIARMEWYREGQVPLHTLRADISYGIARANTTYGVIGIKVWIYKGEVVSDDDKAKKLQLPEEKKD